MSLSPEEARKLDRVGWQVNEIVKDLQQMQGLIENNRRDVEDVKDKQREDHEAFTKYVAVAEAAAKATKDLTDKTVTSKQLYISFAATVAALGGLIVGVLGFIHG